MDNGLSGGRTMGGQLAFGGLSVGFRWALFNVLGFSFPNFAIIVNAAFTPIYQGTQAG